METRQQVEHAKAYLNAMHNPKNLLHGPVLVSKLNRDVHKPEVSHGLDKQKGQSSSMCFTEVKRVQTGKNALSSSSPTNVL